MTILIEPKPAPERPAAERRAEQRRRVLKGAIARFNGGYGALECVVRDISAGGARLAFGDTGCVPPHFELTIAGEGCARAAEVRWRTPSAVGVSLI